MDKPDNLGSRMRSRRDVLKQLAAGSAAAAGAMLPGAVHAAASSDHSTHWTLETDVIVVGSGAAGTSAALAAGKAGASVLMLEKMPFNGGTAAKSGGVFWIPNNPYLKSIGVADEREDALRYMVRLAYPNRYNVNDALLGITQTEFDLIATFYDNASRVIETLVANSGMKIMPWYTWNGSAYPDYYANLPENKVHLGRSLVVDVNGHPERYIWPKGGGAGESMLWQIQQGFAALPIKIMGEHRALNLIKNAKGEITGLMVDSGDDQPINIRARKAVVFCSGGFSHNVEMARTYLKGPIWGSCAAPGSTGDFTNIAIAAGAALGNMANAWWGQVPVEAALKTRSVAADIWSTPGDSMIQVNKYGRRFVNEKIQYNERTQTHFIWDPVKAEYPNYLSFMIWDERTAQHYAGYDPVPAANAKSEHVIEGASWSELIANIEQHLAAIAQHTGDFHLDKNFADTLKATLKRYNELAKKGIDEDFSRGQTPIEIAFQFYNLDKAPYEYPNMTMHPIADSGPYYAVILGAGTLDTKGGAVVNTQSQVLDTAGKVIPGLYAAGNCTAHAAGQAYWAGGGTIGPALTFGYIAGTAAAAEPLKNA